MAPVTITPEMTLFEITEQYPETIQVFAANGFVQVADPAKRTSHGKLVTLAQAMQMKNKDLETFRQLLEGAVHESRTAEDITLRAAPNHQSLFPRTGDVRVAGLLPCPVRLPLLEGFASVQNKLAAQGVEVSCELAAASVGADVLGRELVGITSEDDLPHLFLSAGFEAFFDRKNLRRFKDQGAFVDRAWDHLNAAFAGYDLQDPDRHFSMLAVVPAVFLVDKDQIGEGEEIPRTWADLLVERFTSRVALPVGDFDLFNGILLTLWKEFGDAGVRALARNLQQSLHPSQTAGRFAAGRGRGPTVSVIPYFFSKMARLNPQAEVVWPSDGAIISPIFMLLRRQAPEAAATVADYFCSREVGDILAQRGLFPSCHPEVDNPLPPEATFRWLGWDFVREHDLGELIPHLNQVFHTSGASA